MRLLISFCTKKQFWCLERSSDTLSDLALPRHGVITLPLFGSCIACLTFARLGFFFEVGDVELDMRKIFSYDLSSLSLFLFRVSHF